jgi:predicted ATPase
LGEVTVTLLNGFAAEVDGEPVPDRAWRLKKARELVKLLAIAPTHRLHREQIMDVLWGDRAPDAAANNLHQAVHVARRALDPSAIEVRDEMVRLVADVDVDRLEAAATDARRTRTAGAYRAALALYPGDLLPENRYDDWAQERRDELTELASELEDELAELPGTEGAHQSSLPADTSSFIGRGQELTELAALLRNARLLTLAGAGGVGKTRLALELARAAEPAYSGAAFVELAPLFDARLIPGAIAAALDVRALSGQSLLEAVVAFVTPRSLLLVIDNCEHLLVALASIADTLLRSAPELTILATSREPLRVPGEVVFRVPSLDIPNPEQALEPAQLLRYEAVRLFTERGAAAVPGFDLDRDNAADVARICFRLDGLPLALELAAARLGALGPAAIAQRLDDRFQLLRRGSHSSPTRQHTLAATLEWSHDLLEPDERKLFRRLSAFAGGFELEAVENVCADTEVERAGIADVLARLVEKSLVAADEGTSRERRYRLLETVRLYAQQRLDQAGETLILSQRHAEWAFALARERRDSPQLDREAANLRAALDTLLARAPAESLEFCVTLLPFWMRRIDLDEAGLRFDEVLAAASERTALRSQALLDAAAIDLRSGAVARGFARADESYDVACEIGDVRAQWRALQYLGEVRLASDAADEATPWLERALELAHREAFPAAEATCVYSLGVVRWMLGDLDRAEELIAESIELFSALAGSPERIPSPVNLAETSQAGARPGLRLVFEDTLQPFFEISCDAAVGYVLANQAGIARVRGDLERARQLLDESAARFEALGDDQGRAAVLVRRAYLELAEDAVAPARVALEDALALRRAHGDRRGIGLVLVGLGLIATIAGAYDAADRHLAEARDIFRRAGDRWGLASALWRTADLDFARGELDEAEGALQEARAVLGPTQRERWIANTLVGLAEIARLRGESDAASLLLADARERYAARHDTAGVADVDERLDDLAKDLLSAVKEPPRRTPDTF